MRYILSIISLIAAHFAWSQCTVIDATDCVCSDTTQSDCTLLPDLSTSWDATLNHFGGPNEYAQTGNEPNNGLLRVTSSTPNTGIGPLTVRGVDTNGNRWFVCNSDTFSIYDPGSTQSFSCPNNGVPRQIIFQRVYHKNGNTMTYTDQMAGTMTYHPTHGHNHVDDWMYMTLRIEDPYEPDPRNWSIVGEGAKIGFCLMDYGSCSTFPGHCKDNNTVYNAGTTLLNTDFPNYGLGGGQYACSVVEQGISVGFTDVYSENLDGMFITIPTGTCNGDYWIVMEVDPNNNFVESDDTNNYTAVPFTLTQQDTAGNPQISITPNPYGVMCNNNPVVLTATAGFSYQWSTGDTTQSIVVSSPGSYSVIVNNYCGTDTAFTTVASLISNAPTATGDSICAGDMAVLNAVGDSILWYDDNGFLVATGSTFNTPTLTATTTYFAGNLIINPGVTVNVGKPDSTGGGVYSTNEEGILFDVTQPLVLQSVKVYANGNGNRTIQLLDIGGNTLYSTNVFIPNGESRVMLNYDIAPGNDYQLMANTGANLFVNNANPNSNINFPYQLVDTVSVYSSTLGSGVYYYFYDWEVLVGNTSCVSATVPAVVMVDPCIGINERNIIENASVYPNPSNNWFNLFINAEQTIELQLTIRDVLGKVVLSEQMVAGKNYTKTIQLNAKGIFFLQLTTPSKQTITKKIILN